MNFEQLDLLEPEKDKEDIGNVLSPENTRNRIATQMVTGSILEYEKGEKTYKEAKENIEIVEKSLSTEEFEKALDRLNKIAMDRENF